MARTTGPLLSLSAAGTIARTLSYGRNRSGSFVRFRTMPADPRSQKQLAYRSAIRMLSMAWHDISAARKALWHDLPTAARLSPYHAYCELNLQLFRQSIGLGQVPDYSIGDLAPTYDAPTIANVDGRVTLTVPNLDPGSCWGVYIWRDTATDPPHDLEHCLATCAISSVRTYTWFDTPPAPGHYYYHIRPYRWNQSWKPTFPELDVVL